MSEIDLKKLAEPFALDDIEWRVSRAGLGKKGVYAFVLAYITARAIQGRLDEVCGPANWQIAEPRTVDVNGKNAFIVGISIRIDDEWVTKWDAADPTNIEPSKGGFSGAMKRAGAQWGIGRYLYHLEETFAEVTEDEPSNTSRQWKQARTPKDKGNREYWWKPPALPNWALPKDEQSITEGELRALKDAWRDKLAPGVKSGRDLHDGFSRFVTSVVGEFPLTDFKCWTQDALERCQKRIDATTEPAGISSDVPFER